MDSAEPKPITLEQNQDFAYLVANSLNNLIDKGVLTTTDVSQAKDEILIEYIDRFEHQIFPNIDHNPNLKRIKTEFDSKDEGKIRTLFSSEMIKNEQINQPTRDRIIKFARAMQQLFDETNWKIKGIIIFGSRLDPNKKPRPNSDLDMIFVMDMTDTELITELKLLRLESDLNDETPIALKEESFYQDVNWFKRYTMTKLGFEDMRDVNLELAGMININLFQISLDISYIQDLPQWGWNPKAVYFVGNLGDGEDEKKVNQIIQKQITSPVANDIRKKTLDDIRRAVLKTI